MEVNGEAECEDAPYELGVHGGIAQVCSILPGVYGAVFFAELMGAKAA